ncbi:sugar phosphate nucleotidyltransferase [Blattabacterium cuenoti]|uniref:sugar phosphate nucleotidyltransferase n=1 Tax=Blattabacterium cuenoti TaxID=1653831 RepID=UPI00163CF135|nr:sugar phosphate nucleotidyltransferase [Blattabacterium cuenoti]
MKIIIPMAGNAVRLYPHTLNTIKPLVSIAGKTILKRLMENLNKLINTFSIKEIIFIIPPCKEQIKKDLIKFSKNIGLVPIIYYQKVPIGTADALLKAHKSLIGPIIIAFSDTLFYHFSLEKEIQQQEKQCDGIVWTKKVKNPHSFGVVQCHTSGIISHFVEKPKNFQSNLAIIGLYYFKNSCLLKRELQLLQDTFKWIEKKEYQLTYVLESMRKKGIIFINHQVSLWLDFGNKERTISSNSKILSIESKRSELIHKDVSIVNSLIIKPCYIGKKTIIENSIIGPYVSIGKYTIIKKSNIRRSIIQDYTNISNVILDDSIIGNSSIVKDVVKKINIGDYSNINII